jgi:hypothetical protein
MPIERILRANMPSSSSNKIVKDGMTLDRCLTACMGFEIATLASKPDVCFCFKSAAEFFKAHTKQDLESCEQAKSVRPQCSGDVRVGGVCGSTDELDVYLVDEQGKGDAKLVARNLCLAHKRFERYRFDGSSSVCPLPTCGDSRFEKCEGKNTHGVQYSKRHAAFEKSAKCASHDGCKVEECCEAIPTCVKDQHICEKDDSMELKENVLNPKKIYTLQKTNTKCAPESIVRTKEECAKALVSVGKSSNIGYDGAWLTGHNVPAGCSENHFNPDFSSDKTRGKTPRKR